MPESPFGANVGKQPGLEIWRIEVRTTQQTMTLQNDYKTALEITNRDFDCTHDVFAALRSSLSLMESDF